MTAIKAKQINANKIQLTGALNFDTVPALRQQFSKWFPFMPDIIIDLAAVIYCDSSGVALLLECLRLAKAGQKKIIFINIPTQLLALAKATAVAEILPIHDNNNTH
ncbi:MAG: lipid asymmetry maintenance protein MlaB [Gammaproteobacteria bacterium]